MSPPDVMETRAHTTQDGMLQLELDVGVADVDVTVIIRLIPPAHAQVEGNGWPIDFFEKVAGSMPHIETPTQGEFQERLPLR